MAAITFPASPALNDIHSVGTRSWKYNGTAWKLVPKTTDAILEGSNNLYYTDARVAAAPAVTALETRAGNIESAATTLAGRVTTSEGNITTLTSGLATEKGRVDAILSASDADKDSFAEIVQLINSVNTDSNDAFAGYVTSNNAAVAAIDGRVTTLEGQNHSVTGKSGEIYVSGDSTTGYTVELDAPIKSDLQEFSNDITNLAAAVYNNEGGSRIADLEYQDGQISYRIDAVEGRLTTAEQYVSDTDGKLINTQNEVASLQGTLGNVETEVTNARNSGTFGSKPTLADRLDYSDVQIQELKNELEEARNGQPTLDARLDAVDSYVDSVQGRLVTAEYELDSVESAIGEQGGRISTLENQVSSVEVALGLGGDGPGKQTKNALDITAPSHEEGRIWIDTSD
jgi:predicted  nucleic acid-binding Zn-ribbon protein